MSEESFITLDAKSYQSLQEELRQLRRQVASFRLGVAEGETASEVEQTFSLNFSAVWNQKRFQEIAVTFPGAIFMFTSRHGVWSVDYISEGVFDLAGVTAEEMMVDVNKFIERVHPEDLNNYINSVVEVLEKQSPWLYEGRLIKPDGEVRWWQGKSRPYKNQNGEIFFSGVLLDVTERKQAEIALIQSEAQVRLFVEHAPAAVAMFDRDMNYLLVSRRWQEDLGLSDQNLIGRNHYDVFPHISEDWKEVHRRCLAGAIEKCDEETLMRGDGTIDWLKWEVRPWYTRNGEIGGIIILTEVITRQKQAEEFLKKLNEELEARVEERTARLHQQNSELQAVFDAFPDLFFRLAADSSIVDYKAGCQYSQFHRDYQGCLGKSMAEILPAGVGEEMVKAIEKTLATQGLVSMEYSLLMPGGEEYYECRFLPFEENQVIAIVRNISERKKAEAALLRSEERFRCLIEATSQIIWTTDADGKVRQKQPSWCAFTGQNDDELTEWDWLNAVHPEDRESTAALWAAAINNKTVYKVEHRLRRFDGEYRYMSVRGVPVLNSDGTIREWIGTHTDITERKQAEILLRQKSEDLERTLGQLQRTQSHLVQSEKMSSLGQLVAGVAHEINNPVNFIHGNLVHAADYADNLLEIVAAYQRHYPNPAAEIADLIEEIELDFLVDDFPKLLRSMKVGTQRIREIITSLRNFSRLDEAEVKEVNIHDGIDSTLMILHSRLKPKTNRPEVEVVKQYGNLPRVECYPGQLNQVFMNILVNAVDALEERDRNRTSRELQKNPSRIVISTQLIASGTQAKITIRDNGPGMSEAVRNRIFDPFFTTKGVGKGTGLGMSISYQIITDKHNGLIECFSSLGEGSTFVIQIPIYQGTT